MLIQMCGHRRVGVINSISDIPFNRHLILSGELGSGYMWRMPGVFRKDNNETVFINHCDIKTQIDDETKINLLILEKIKP